MDAKTRLNFPRFSLSYTAREKEGNFKSCRFFRLSSRSCIVLALVQTYQNEYPKIHDILRVRQNCQKLQKKAF